MTEIWRTFSFDAAHYLPKVPAGHKCGGMHGHTYSVEVRLRGEVDAVTGWVRDFGDLKEAFRPLEQELDHKVLNDVPGLDNPTSELLARWLWQRLRPTLPELYSVTVSETPTSGVVYRDAD
ncbi:6-carboxytetrahydropterin synthase QueD [Blastococcus sp. SYSU DS0617]